MWYRDFIKRSVLLSTLLVTAAVYGQVAPPRLDLSNPVVRKMILNERKGLNCSAVYQQTHRRFDAQLKVLTNEASFGVKPETVSSLTEITTALGQKRREFCEFYKADPELTKEDYFRVYGELAKSESDLSLMFRYATGRAAKEELGSLQTVTPQQSGGSVDVDATLGELLRTIDSVSLRVQRAEERATEALSLAQRTQQQVAEEQQAKREADDRRRMAPVMSVDLEPLTLGKVRLRITSQNLVPFEFNDVVVTTENVIVSGIPMGFAKIFPTADRRVFVGEIAIQTDRVRESYLELRFRYRSLVAEELMLPGHEGEITHKYKASTDYSQLLRIE